MSRLNCSLFCLSWNSCGSFKVIPQPIIMSAAMVSSSASTKNIVTSSSASTKNFFTSSFRMLLKLLRICLRLFLKRRYCICIFHRLFQEHLHNGLFRLCNLVLEGQYVEFRSLLLHCCHFFLCICVIYCNT